MNRYRILFTRHRPSSVPTVAARATPDHRVLVAADLPPSHPRFPWPSDEDTVERLLRRVVLHRPGS